MVAVNPGDVTIGYAVISGAGGFVDISRRIHDFSVFENVLKPYTSIVMNIIDNTDVLNFNVGLDGTNTLQLAFGQPGQDPYVSTWTLTSIEKSRSTRNQRTVTYKATGYSPHMTSFPVVQKSYIGTTATGIVSDLFGMLPAIKGLSINAPSMGPLGSTDAPYQINGIQIWKAIRSTLLKGASSVDPSSAYTMFENNKGIVVDTLEHLLDQALAAGGPVYFQRPLGGNFFVDAMQQQFTIIDLKEETRVDSTATAQDQVATNTIDFFSNAFGKGATGGASTYFNLAYNLLQPATLAKNFMAARKQIASAFDSQSVTIRVPLNPAVTVGGAFTVNTLAPIGDTNTAVPDLLSGPLLATEVRHVVDLSLPRMQGQTIAKGVRGGITGASAGG